MGTLRVVVDYLEAGEAQTAFQRSLQSKSTNSGGHPMDSQDYSVDSLADSRVAPQLFVELSSRWRLRVLVLLQYVIDSSERLLPEFRTLHHYYAHISQDADHGGC
jgi:hypothetical protein